MGAVDVGIDLLGLRPTAEARLTVRDTLEYQAELVRQAHGRRRAVVARLLRGHGMADGTDEQIFAAPLPLDDARLLVAYEHGYRDWPDAMAHGTDLVDRGFEAAADAMVIGDLDTLRTLLAQRPALIATRSAYWHHATLAPTTLC